jgi:tetratricopeptide (TPR) repeat protein
MEMGKSHTEFADAASEFERAIRLAPWWAEAYRGLAMAREKAANYQQAIDTYQFYLLAAPSATDAKEVQSKIYKLEFAAEREQKQAIEQSMSQRQQAARTLGLQGIWHEKGNGMVWQAAMQDRDIRCPQ